MATSQRYRLTHEFVLRDRSAYQAAIAAFQRAIREVHLELGSNPDYLAFEKVEAPDDRPR